MYVQGLYYKRQSAVAARLRQIWNNIKFSNINLFQEIFYWIFSFYVRYSTPLHLPPPQIPPAVSEETGIETRTVATLALAARRSKEIFPVGQLGFMSGRIHAVHL